MVVVSYKSGHLIAATMRADSGSWFMDPIIGDTRPSPFSHRSASFFPGSHHSHLSSDINSYSTTRDKSYASPGPASGSGSSNPARPSLLNGYQHPVSTSRGTYADSPPQSPVERGGSPDRDVGPRSSAGVAGNGNGHALPLPHLERSHGLMGESRQLPSLPAQRNGQDSNGRASGISLPPIGAALTPRGTMLLPSRSRDRPSPIPLVDARASPRDSTPHSISGIERAGSVRRDRAREVTRPDSPPPVGSCPGDGRCNGTGGKMGCEGCPTYNNSSSKVVLDGQHTQAAGTCAGSARRQQQQQEQAAREKYAMTRGGSPMEGVEPGYNPLIAASHAQNGAGKASVRSPGSKSARYTDEEGQSRRDWDMISRTTSY